MPLYTYKAKDTNGKKVAGAMEAFTENGLIEKLHQKKLLIVSVAEKKAKGASTASLQKLFSQSLTPTGGKVKLASLLSFSTQLSAMLSAGLPLTQSLQGLSFDIQDKRLQGILTRIESEVQSGHPLSESMAIFPRTFDKIYVNLIRAGESSGKLGDILNQLCNYLEYRFNLRRKVKSALTYPCVVVTFAVLVIIFMVVKIIPKFENVYRGFGKELPLPTQILMSISNQAQNHFFLGIFSVIGLLILFILFSRTLRGRRILDRIKLNLPVFGPIIKKSIVSTFSRTLSILVNSGIPLVPAMRLSIQTINNRVVAEKLLIITSEVEKGGGVGLNFRKSGFFPEMMVQMIVTGEKTGSIDIMILKAAEFYEKQVDSTISTLTTLLEPIIIAVVGFLVGGIMLAMFLPVFKLGGVMH